MFTICVSDDLLQFGSEVIISLNDAIVSSLSNLKDTDQVCFNIGNSSQLLICDWQKNLAEWNKVSEQFESLKRILNKRESIKIVNLIAEGDTFIEAGQGQKELKRNKFCEQIVKLLNSVKGILFNATYFLVYGYSLWTLRYTPMGSCYAGDSMYPKFDTPEAISIPGEFDLKNQKYDEAIDSEKYKNVTLRLSTGIVIEMYFCLFGIAYSLITLFFKMNKGLGNKLTRANRFSVVLRMLNLFFGTINLYGSDV